MQLDEKLLGSYPDPMNKEQFRTVCHISKRTALYFLQSGLVPNIHTGHKTHSYMIKKKDVIAFADDYAKHPFKYLAPDNWYVYKDPRPNGYAMRCRLTGDAFREKAKVYYRLLLEHEQDLLTVRDINRITGYSANAVTRWIREGKLMVHYAWSNRYYIPKEFLYTFLCSDAYNDILKKSMTHAAAILEISGKLMQDPSEKQ